MTVQQASQYGRWALGLAALPLTLRLPLPLRPGPAGTTIFELRRPAPRSDARTPFDLRVNPPQALRGTGSDPARPSAWIAEGMVIYLLSEMRT